MKPHTKLLRRLPLACAALGLAAGAHAQPVKQEVKPPVAQAWIDIATFSGMGLPGMMGGPAGGMPSGLGGALGGLFGGGGGGAKVNFLMTQSGGAGRFVDVTVGTRSNPSLAEATQEVPASMLSPALKLLAPREAPPAPVERDDEVVHEPQRPQGKLFLYWGCGDAVRAGQPRVVDFATASVADLAQVFQARRATQRGAHSAAGRPHWPNPNDGRALPDSASLVGAHQISGSGIPEGFKFNIPAAQDLMPPLQLQQADRGGALALSWNAQPNARAFFVMAMGARGQNEMVVWTSSELPDFGMGLMDYQTNAAVDRWLKDKVLLAPSTTSCTVPKGVFAGEGAMLRAIAYGHELNLVHPPRPTDPKVAWEPQWAVKVRVKTMASTMVGMPAMEEPQRAQREQAPRGAEADTAEKKDAKKPSALDVLRGVIGR
ncbi:MAG: hypothetical protein U1E89_03010 [Burkholderiaceae bacterium]